jgi:hypothetical protein
MTYRRANFRRSTRAQLPPAALSGSGHPSDASGFNGNTYTRTDRNGWIYTKADGVWSLNAVGVGTPDPIGTNQWYFASPYVTFTGQRGDQQTNGKSFDPYSISALGTTPSNSSGANGTNNIQQVNDPVFGAPRKSILIRLQEGDADTGGTGASRTMFRYLSDAICVPAWTDANSTRITLRMYTTYVAAFSVMIPQAMYDYCFTTKPGMQNVLWQIHDNSVGTSLSPNFEFRLGGRTDTSMGKTTGDVRIAFAVRYTQDSPPGLTQANVTTVNYGNVITVVPDTWMHFIVEFRLAYLEANSPFTRVHTALQGGAWSTPVDSTSPNAYPADHATKGTDFDHYWTFGQYIFTPSLLNSGTVLDIYFRDQIMSNGGFVPSSDELDDLKQYLQAR